MFGAYYFGQNYFGNTGSLPTVPGPGCPQRFPDQPTVADQLTGIAPIAADQLSSKFAEGDTLSARKTECQ
jgi:hypothetical protein